jgi:PAS domain S-box-containing protein
MCPSYSDALSPDDFPAEELLGHVNDVVTVIDATGTVLFQSDSSERVKGWRSDELVGRNVFRYIHPDDREFVATEMRARVDSPGQYDEALEYRFQTPEGEWQWLASTASNPGPDSPIDGYIVTSRNVTERKRLEVDRDRVTDRLGTFASMVSHDLRNPLGVLKGTLKLAEETGEAQYFERSRRAVERMDTLIEALLRLAREGEVIGDTEPVEVAAIARDAWDSVATDAATLAVETTATVEADRLRLREALENLFQNSVEHGSTGNRASPDDSVEHSSTSSRPKAGDSVERGPDGVTVTVEDTDHGFAVADDGPGLETADPDEPFEVGYSTAEDGFGLGLAIVEEIVEAHGWEIAVDTGDGDHGARFEIRTDTR